MTVREAYMVEKITPKKKYKDFGKGKCVRCGKDLPPRKRKYCCHICQLIYLDDTRTKNYVSWQAMRRRIIKRDDFTCQDCGSFRGFEDDHPRAGEKWPVYGDWEVHHIVPISKGGEMWDPENLTTLCDECHKKRHAKKHREPMEGQKSLENYGGLDGIDL